MKVFFTIVLAMMAGISSYAQFDLVRDFNGSSASTFKQLSYDGFLAKLGTKVLVRYDTTENLPVGEGATMLVVIDANGNADQIMQVPLRDDDYGPTFYDFRELSDGRLVFIVNSDDTEYKIIVTDGTLSGTEELYVSSTRVIGLEVISSGLFFTHAHPGGNMYELAKIDLATGTVSYVLNFGLKYSISDISKTDDNTLIFYATGSGDELKLYRSDGTTAGTTEIADLYDGSGVSQQTVMTQVGNKVYFFYTESGTDCCNYLWVTDGTSSGTTKVKEFNMVSFIDYERSRSAVAWNNKFYFMGVEDEGNSNNDRVLWVSDGTEAGTIALHSPEDFRRPHSFTLFNNKMYFVAYDLNTYNNRLYVTDGTPTGTEVVVVKYGSYSIYAYDIAASSSYLYMAAYCTGQGEELFRYDGTELECVMAEAFPGNEDASPNELIVNGDDLYFIADMEETGREVYTATFVTEEEPEPVTGVLEAAGMKVAIFPNPATTMLEVQTEKSIGQMVLLNGQGKELASTSQTTMHIQDFPAGVYCLKVVFEDQTTTVSRVMISK